MFYHIFLNKKIGEKERNRSLANKFIIFREKRSQNLKKKKKITNVAEKCVSSILLIYFFNIIYLFIQNYLSKPYNL